MSPKPTRATVAGRAYLDLRQVASQQGRSTQEFLHFYALEGFLARLSSSPHDSQFVLKGGMLLSALGARRPTRDVDLAASALHNDAETIRAAVQAVVTVAVDDGLEFDTTATTAQVIREEDDYSGVRVSVPCKLASATIGFHVDVNVGDPIWPAPTEVEIPRILGGTPLRVPGYPILMVLAEKIVTILQRGTANTRWRDFVDITTLSRRHRINARRLRRSIQTVADHRQATIRRLADVLDSFATSAQPQWIAWRRRHELEDSTPALFGEVLRELFLFVDPLLDSPEFNASWDPESGTWVTK